MRTAGADEGIVKGLYLYKASEAKAEKGKKVQLLGSGVLLKDVVRAQAILAAKFGVAADVWSAPSYVQLRREALECERWNMLHPADEPRVPYVLSQLAPAEGPIVATSDYMKAVPEMIAKWFPDRFFALGTDGFGRSDSRAKLRHFFEVNRYFVAIAALKALADQGEGKAKTVADAIKKYEIDPDKADPTTV